MSSFEKIRRYKIAALEDAALRGLPAMDVFVAGPYVELDKPDADPVNSSTTSKAARYRLCKELEKLGHQLYLGEDTEMRKLGVANFGAHNNAVVYERHHILHRCDAVIAIPSSPGSFCEIGDWITTKDICRRLLVIIDSKYHGEVNYINEGVVKLAKNNGAKVEYISLVDSEAILNSALKFLEGIDQEKRVDQLYGRA